MSKYDTRNLGGLMGPEMSKFGVPESRDMKRRYVSEIIPYLSCTFQSEIVMKSRDMGPLRVQKMPKFLEVPEII